MSDRIITSSSSWSENDRLLLSRLARLVIGEDPEGRMPSATDDTIFAAILIRAIDFAVPIRRGLDLLEPITITDMSDQALQATLEAKRELRSLLRAMMQVTAQCYYEDKRVLTLLGFDARPPFPQGHEVESGDWSLLDAVRDRYNST